MAKYRMIGSLSPDSRIDRLQVTDDKVLELHRPDEGKFGNAVSLTDAQADKARHYVQLEQVADDVGEYVFGAEEAAAAESEPEKKPDEARSKAASGTERKEG